MDLKDEPKEIIDYKEEEVLNELNDKNEINYSNIDKSDIDNTVSEEEQENEDKPDESQNYVSFKDINISSWIIKKLQTLAIDKPTDVQKNCIPPILQGRNCIACAKTGSGKTFAFAIPILQKLHECRYGVFALVLAPSRELVKQIYDHFKTLDNSLRIESIIGGQDIVRQGGLLSKKPEIIVCTPGRLADHINSGADIWFDNLKYVVLDEADQLFTGDNFNEQLTTIFSALPKDKQTLMFSATITQALLDLQKEAKTETFIWSFKDESKEQVVTVKSLDQKFVESPHGAKEVVIFSILQKFISKKPNTSAIVFFPSCRSCHAHSIAFKKLEFNNVALHSMIPQRERIRALNEFKSKRVKLLFATDVASRGLDIPNVDLVINFHAPEDPKLYIHRVGRTARAGRSGISITLMAPYDVEHVKKIEAEIGTSLKPFTVKASEIDEMMNTVKLSVRLAERELEDDDIFGKRKKNYERKRRNEEAAGVDISEPMNKKAKKIKKSFKRR